MSYPDFVTHYSRGIPFQSMTSVSQKDLPTVIDELTEDKAWGLARFSDPEYLERRLATEKLMRQLF